MSPGQGLRTLEFWPWLCLDPPFTWKISWFSHLETKIWPKSLVLSPGCPLDTWGTLKMPHAQAGHEIIIPGGGTQALVVFFNAFQVIPMCSPG